MTMRGRGRRMWIGQVQMSGICLAKMCTAYVQDGIGWRVGLYVTLVISAAVQVGRIANERVRVAGAAHAHLLARHEFQAAVRAKVQHRVRLRARGTVSTVDGLPTEGWHGGISPQLLITGRRLFTASYSPW